MPKTLAVILGAGASHDLIANRTALVNDDLTPPLANGLFVSPTPGAVEFGKHGLFAQSVLEKYPRAVAAAATLGVRGRRPLEQVLRDMSESREEHTRRQFVQVPVYLWELFHTICRSYFNSGYTSEPVNYTVLLNRILRSEFEHVVLITTNYDTFLEKTLSGVVDASFDYLGSYVAATKWTLVKLHGSVNWRRRIQGVDPPNSLTGYLQILDDITRGDADGVRGRLGALLVSESTELWDGDGPLYPALVVPIQGKYEYVCPEDHLQRVRELLRGCRNFLIIGSSGRDDDLLDLLASEVNLVFRIGVVSSGDTMEVYKNFLSGVPTFGADQHPLLKDRGFSEFITSGDLDRFLDNLWDDETRGTSR